MRREDAVFPKAFAVWFKDLGRWDAPSFQEVRWHWPEHVMAPIGSILKARKERVDRNIHQFSDLQMITIHFDGTIDKRIVEADLEYSMDLWFARPGDLVVAKIDLKNGAVGIITSDWPTCAVTGHFAVYESDQTKLVPEYLHRIIQLKFFKAHLWRNKVGAEGRKEVKLDFFLDQPIPLPDLDTQKHIVAHWRQVYDEIAAAQVRIEELKRETDSRFFADLGLSSPDQLFLPKSFGVQWEEFRRWGVRFNQLSQVGADISQGTYPLVELNSILDLVQYGTSEKANITNQGIPILRIGNIKERAIDLGSLKHISLPERTLNNLLLKDGDVLIIRTSGSRDLVGTCAVFRESGDYVFASYLIRLRFDFKKAVPEFISWFLNTPLGRQQVDAVSRQIMQNNINSEELGSLQIPLPPIDVQRQIMNRVEGRLSEIAQIRKYSNQRRKEIDAEIEALILGTKKIKDD